MPRRLWVLCLAFCLAGFAVPARAGLIVSIGNASVAQGGTGTVDVLLTSTAGSQAPDLINNYAFQLQITNNGADNTQLAFSANQDFGYISNTGLHPAYLFLGAASMPRRPHLRSAALARRCIPTTHSQVQIPLTAATR